MESASNSLRLKFVSDSTDSDKVSVLEIEVFIKEKGGNSGKRREGGVAATKREGTVIVKKKGRG